MNIVSVRLIFTLICLVSIVTIGISIIAFAIRYNRLKEQERSSNAELQKILLDEIKNKEKD